MESIRTVPNRTLLKQGAGEYLVRGTLKKKISESRAACGGCKVIVTAYAHGLTRQLPNDQLVSPPDAFIVSDSTDMNQINQAVEWGKFFADEIKAAGADWVILVVV